MQAMKNEIEHYGEGLFACVMDSYDYDNALDNVLPKCPRPRPARACPCPVGAGGSKISPPTCTCTPIHMPMLGPVPPTYTHNPRFSPAPASAAT